MTEQDENRIRERAHQMWTDNGCPADRALDYWLAAERELLGAEAENLDAGAVVVPDIIRTGPDIVRTGKAKMLDGPHIGEEAGAARRAGSSRTRTAGTKPVPSNGAARDLGGV